MQHSYGSALAAALLASLAVTGCGLKGALTMPSKSEEVVIRAPAEAAPAEPTQDAPAKKPRQGRAHSAAAAARRQSRHRPRWLTHAHWCSWMARRTSTGPSTHCRR